MGQVGDDEQGTGGNQLSPLFGHHDVIARGGLDGLPNLLGVGALLQPALRVKVAVQSQQLRQLVPLDLTVLHGSPSLSVFGYDEEAVL